MGFLTVDELKDQLNIPRSDESNDAELDVYAGAASSVVESLCGPIAQRTVTNEEVAVGSHVLVLEKHPVVSLTAVGLSSGLSSYAYDPALFTFDGDRGVVRRVDNARVSGRYLVTYVAGYSTPPEWARLGARLIGSYMWETQRGGRKRDPIPTVTLRGYEIPKVAAMVLQDHLNDPAFA